MLTAEEREVLELVVEDYYGLWEIVWRLENVFGPYPNSAAGEAARIVEGLRSHGLVTLWVREWTDDEPLPLGQTGHVVNLRNPSTWAVPPPDQHQILITATELGRGELATRS